MAICGSPASHDATLVVVWHNTTPFALVTGGLRQLRVWSFDAENRKVRPKEVFTGKEVRDFISVAMDPSDAFLYAGTKSGDVIKVETGSKRMVTAGPRKRLKEGVSSIQYNAARPYSKTPPTSSCRASARPILAACRRRISSLLAPAPASSRCSRRRSSRRCYDAQSCSAS